MRLFGGSSLRVAGYFCLGATLLWLDIEATGRAEKLDSNVPPVEESIARDRDLLIINPNSPPLGPDGHRDPVAGPA